MIILTVLKIILITLLIIIGILIVAMVFPVSIKVSYTGEKKYYKIKYAFLTLISSDGKKGLIGRLKKSGKKETKKAPSDSESEPEKESEAVPPEEAFPEKNISSSPESDTGKESESQHKKPESPEKSEKPESVKKSRLEKLPETWEKIMQIWEIASSPVKRLCKGIHFDRIYIDFKISDPDACDCAINYGRMCVLVYNILGVFDQMFSLTKKSIDVACVFNKEKSVYDISFTVRFYPIVCLGCGISFLWTYYFKIYKNKSGGNKSGKQGNKKRKAHK